jgi:hypothetical protein
MDAIIADCDVLIAWGDAHVARAAARRQTV